MVPNTSEVVIYGKRNVGKSSILKYWRCNEVHPNVWELNPNIYFKSKSRPIKIKERVKNFDIDREIGEKLSVLVYIFDRSDISSFYQLHNDLDTLAKYEIECYAIIILGHKNDLKNYGEKHIDFLFDFIENLSYFKNIHISYFTTSITTGENLGIVFKYFVELSKSMFIGI